MKVWYNIGRISYILPIFFEGVFFMKMSGIKEVRLYHTSDMFDGHSRFRCQVDYFSGRQISYLSIPNSVRAFIDNVNQWLDMYGSDSEFHNWKYYRLPLTNGYVAVYCYRDLSKAL